VRGVIASVGTAIALVGCANIGPQPSASTSIVPPTSSPSPFDAEVCRQLQAPLAAIRRAIEGQADGSMTLEEQITAAAEPLRVLGRSGAVEGQLSRDALALVEWMMGAGNPVPRINEWQPTFDSFVAKYSALCGAALDQ
jgi:hypothetical protein